jgi:hypothetical protein
VLLEKLLIVVIFRIGVDNVRKLILITCLFVTVNCLAALSSNKPPLRIQENDGAPSCYPWSLGVTNDSLTCNNDGTANLNIGGITSLIAGTGISISCTNGVCTITNTGGGGTTYVLMEDASIILAEDDSKVLTE